MIIIQIYLLGLKKPIFNQPIKLKVIATKEQFMKLKQFLEEGYTLEEIGREFNVATSYVSEYMKMIGLDKDDFKDRKTNKLKRKEEGNKLTFMEEFWYLIRHEIGR